jgi:hypothetical protein
MSKKITEIPYWGVFLDCFPDLFQIYESQNPENLSDGHWLAIARMWRNALLNESDWSQISDNSLTESQREIWRNYRTELRNITETYPDPKDIVFPDLPS